MTTEELNALLAQAADPNNAPVALATLKDKVTDLITASSNAAIKAQEDAKTIQDLRDTNMRMFLRVTGEAGGQEEHEETVDELNARLRAALLGENKED